MYVCGPTVYDVSHLGHGRTALVFDVVRRYLEWSGYRVTYLSNVTDIDDKIIERAARDGTTEPELAATYTTAYWTEMERLGVRRPDAAPHATEFVDDMQRLIAQLVDRGAAYVIEGEGVYFEIGTFEGYGQLSHRSLAELADGAGARVEVDERKRSPMDFALWKAAKPGEPTWDSPWGPGRPGWHIECAAMSLEILGDSFDLHGGGDDLVFPHHENERAEAEAAGHEFARHWLHSGMVNVGGEKMSKSLGNFTNLADAIDEHGPRAFRLAVLQAHYRSPMELGRDVLTAAQRAVDGLDALARRSRAAEVRVAQSSDDAVVQRFRAAMDDDFATPAALATIFDAASDANRSIDAGDADTASILLRTVTELLGVLGLDLDDGRGGADSDIDALVDAREDARRSGDFETADRLRDDLATRGVTIEDTPAGPVWRRSPLER